VSYLFPQLYLTRGGRYSLVQFWTTQTINNTVIFLKESEINLTSFVRRVLFDVEISRYTDIVANVQSDLEMVKHVKQSYTPLYAL
jgi:hypothetical protein